MKENENKEELKTFNIDGVNYVIIVNSFVGHKFQLKLNVQQ